MGTVIAVVLVVLLAGSLLRSARGVLPRLLLVAAVALALTFLPQSCRGHGGEAIQITLPSCSASGVPSGK